ncbi:MAG TPA: tetratricopeptide repeat protein [Nitrospiria bacterium]
MGKDRGSILQNAQKYTAKGLHDKAIEEWQKLIKETPNDGNIYNTIGDLYLKKNSISEATNAFLKAADSFDQAGFALKTIAVYKKIIKIDPNRFDVFLKLGDVNAERGLVGNALGDYLKVAKHYVGTGKLKEGVEVYRKIIKLDPQNVSIRIKLAEMCVKEGLKTEAVEEYLGVAEIYGQGGRKEEAIKLYDQILKIAPSHPTAKQLKNKLEGGALEGSEVSETPEEVQTASHQTEMVKPDKVFGSPQKGVQTGAEESQASPLSIQNQEDTPVDPTRVPTALEPIVDEGAVPSLEEELPVFEEPVEKILEPTSLSREEGKIPEGEVVELSDPSSLVKEFSQSSPKLSGDESGTPTPADEETPQQKMDEYIQHETIEGFFAEADVYLKYGLPQKAIDQLKGVLKQDPYNQKARLQLKEIYKNEGQIPEAVMECLKLAKIFELEGEPDRYNQILQEAMDLDPNNRQVKLMAGVSAQEREDSISQNLESSGVSSVSIPSAQETSESSQVNGLETEFSEASVTEFNAPLGRKGGPDEGVRSLDEIMNAQPLSPEEVGEKLAEGDFYLQQGLKEEAKRVYELVLLKVPEHPEALKKLTEISVEEDIDREISEIPDSQVLAELSQQEITGEQGIEKDSDSSVGIPASQESIDEISFSSVSESSNEVSFNENLDQPVSEASSREKAEEMDEGFVDLSDVLEEAEDQKELQEVSEQGNIDSELDSIFQEFQKGIQEQFGDEDYETHYNLGIAYKEMGLIHEAIGEFELSIKGDDRFVDSCTMLSTCFVEKGAFDKAAEYLDSALNDPRCNENNVLWLKYELGTLYENQGLHEKALEHYIEVKEADSNFKDVKKRIIKLQKDGPSLDDKGDEGLSDPGSELSVGTSSKKESKVERKKGKISYL